MSSEEHGPEVRVFVSGCFGGISMWFKKKYIY